MKVKEMRAKCVHCHTEVVVSEPREYKTCKCGAISLDAGDGYYSRMGGNIEDFDKEYDKEHGIDRFKAYKIETPETKEHEVDTVNGKPFLPLDTLVGNVWHWFDEKHLNDPVMQMVKVQEEVGELAHEITRNNYYCRETVDALGDILVTIIGMCHHLGIPVGAALMTAWTEIKDRKGEVINGSFVKK